MLTLPGLAAKSSTLRTEAGQLRALVEILCREKRKIVMPTQDMRHLSSPSMKILTDDSNLRRQNNELTGEVREKNARATVESAKLEAVEKELASVKAELAASLVDGANSG